MLLPLIWFDRLNQILVTVTATVPPAQSRMIISYRTNMMPKGWVYLSNTEQDRMQILGPQMHIIDPVCVMPLIGQCQSDLVSPPTDRGQARRTCKNLTSHFSESFQTWIQEGGGGQGFFQGINRRKKSGLNLPFPNVGKQWNEIDSKVQEVEKVDGTECTSSSWWFQTN